MAKETDVKTEHRSHLRWVNEKLLESLSPAELRARCEHASELDARAGSAPAEQARHLTSRKQGILRSIPVVEHVNRKNELTGLAASSSNKIEHDGEGKPHSVAGDYRDMLRDLAGKGHFPPGLETAVDRRLSGMSVPDPGLRDLADKILAHHAASG